MVDGLYIVPEPTVEGVAGHGVGVAQDDELHTGTGDGDIHAAQVAQKADLTAVVGAYERDEDDVAFLTLEAIDSVDTDEMAEGSERLATTDELAQILDLGAVGRDDAHVDALVEHTLAPYLVKVGLERVESIACLALVDATEVVAHKLLAEGSVGIFTVDGGVGHNPLDGVVVVEDASEAHIGRRLHAALIEPVAGEAHNLLVHAILGLQQGDSLGMIAHDALHERHTESALHGSQTLHRGRQLAVVAGKDDALHTTGGYPAGGFEGLGSLVDEEGAKLLTLQDAVGSTGEGRGYHAGFAEELSIDAHLYLDGTLTQPVHLLMEALGVAALPALLAYGLAYSPELRIVGVRLEAALIGEGEHLVVDAGGIAYAQHVDATVHELLGNPVDRHIALRAHQHLALAAQHFIDGLNQGGGLARTGRAVHHHHVLGPEHLVDGVLLGGVEPGQLDVVEGEARRSSMAVEEVAQIGQTVAAGMDDAVQGIGHKPVAGLVEVELHTHLVAASRQGAHPSVVGQGDDHAVAVDIAHHAGEVKVMQTVLTGMMLVGHHAEEGDGAAILKVVLDILVVGAEDLDSQLVEGIVKGVADAQRQPHVATLHQSRHTAFLGLLAKFLFLRFIFQPEQHALLLQSLYG